MFAHCGHKRKTNKQTQFLLVRKSGTSSLTGPRVNNNLKPGFILSNLNHLIKEAKNKKKLLLYAQLGETGISSSHMGFACAKIHRFLTSVGYIWLHVIVVAI